MNVRHDFTPPRLLKDVTGQRHPPPIQIRCCIVDALIAGMDEHKEHLPAWVWSAVDSGIRRANAEHDRSTL